MGGNKAIKMLKKMLSKPFDPSQQTLVVQPQPNIQTAEDGHYLKINMRVVDVIDQSVDEQIEALLLENQIQAQRIYNLGRALEQQKSALEAIVTKPSSPSVFFEWRERELLLEIEVLKKQLKNRDFERLESEIKRKSKKLNYALEQLEIRIDTELRVLRERNAYLCYEEKLPKTPRITNDPEYRLQQEQMAKQKELISQMTAQLKKIGENATVPRDSGKLLNEFKQTIARQLLHINKLNDEIGLLKRAISDGGCPPKYRAGNRKQ